MAGAFVGLVLDAVHDVGAAKITLVAIADRANKDCGGAAWPSLADMAARTDKCERQVRANLRLLEEHAWLYRIDHGGGRSRTTTYQLHIVNMLNALSPENREVHLRELRKLPGAVPPGFTLRACKGVNPTSKSANPEVEHTKPGNELSIPGSNGHETRKHPAPELEEEPEFITRSEPECAPSTLFLPISGSKRKRRPEEPEGTRNANGDLTPEEQKRRQEKAARDIAACMAAQANVVANG